MADNILFSDLSLPDPLFKAVQEVGYESPSPIQAQCIPLLLEGRDLIGQAQTGTGKTAAFALPLLAKVDTANKSPQLMVLAPTRELAIQVAEAMQTYAHFLKDFHVLPIYGGQSYTVQLRQLQRGVQVVVGTPGRIMDHMRRGTLKLDQLRALVLDEADEMLRMGFIDDVEWILEHTPDQRQIALFSATMPNEIRRVAERYLNKPKTVRIESKTTTAATIRQRFWTASGLHKLDALTRVLEVEDFDGVIIFVRTKTATVELADKLCARGFAAEALNGDIAQAQREKTVDRLKTGRIDILIATDVAARGLDVKRISHVINYDIPYDTESYVHRIGRTGRAGREGEAILFVAPRERRMLRAIEKATGQRIESMDMPTVKDINEQRLLKFKQRVIDALGNLDGKDKEQALFYKLVNEVEEETDVDPLEIAAALARMAQGNVPLLLTENEHRPQRREPRSEREPRADRGPGSDRAPRADRGAGERNERHPPKVLDTRPMPLKDFPDVDMERYRVAVGYEHGVKPGNIVGAIANEAELDSKYIGHIEIFDDFTTIDLPAGMPDETFNELKHVWVCQQKLLIERLADFDQGGRKPPKKAKSGGKSESGSKGKQGGKSKGGFKDKSRAAAKSKPKKKPKLGLKKKD